MAGAEPGLSENCQPPATARASGIRDPGPVLRDRARVHAEVGAGDHLGVVGGEEDDRAGVVTRARQLAAFSRKMSCTNASRLYRRASAGLNPPSKGMTPYGSKTRER